MVIIMKKLIVLIVLVALGFVIYNYYPSFLGKTSTWNPHLADVSVSVVGNASYTKPILEGTVMTDYTVTIEKSGDSVTYQLKLVNDGDFSAKLTDIVKSIPRCKASSPSDEKAVCNHLEYTVMNEDGTELEKGFVIPAHSHKKVKLVIGYQEKDSLKNKVLIENLDVDFLFKKEV